MTIFAFGFDATIHLSDLIVFGGGMVAFFKVFLSMRDILRKHTTVLYGDKEVGAPGIIKDVLDLRETVNTHNDALIEASWLDRRGNVRERRHSPQS